MIDLIHYLSAAEPDGPGRGPGPALLLGEVALQEAVGRAVGDVDPVDAGLLLVALDGAAVGVGDDDALAALGAGEVATEDVGVLEEADVVRLGGGFGGDLVGPGAGGQ